MDSSAPETELLVIGGGTAGLLAARTAVGFGADVTLVERDHAPGGECLWTGCVPSKALISCADRVAEARRADLQPSEAGRPAVDFARVRERVRRAVASIAPEDSADSLTAAGVRVVTGSVRFTGPDRVLIQGAGPDRSLGFSQAVIAVGAGPAPTPFPVDDQDRVLTTDTIWELVELPERLVVVGGGTSGCELGQAFARLGSQVSLVEAADRLLPGEDPRAGALVTAALEADGVEVRTGCRVRRVEAGIVVLEGDRGAVPADRVLAALGRRPRTAGLEVACAGVVLDADGYVRVGPTLRTDNPRIWAAGDVVGRPHLTHRAGVHGSLVAANAVLGLRRTVDDAALPRVTFTRPEVATVGVDPVTARARPGWRVLDLDHHHLDRAVTDDTELGLTSLVLDRRGRVRGGVVVGPRAGETIGEVALAVAERISAATLTGVTHPYPTFNDGVWNLAVADYRRSLGRGLNRRLLPILRHARSRRIGRRTG